MKLLFLDDLLINYKKNKYKPVLFSGEEKILSNFLKIKYSNYKRRMIKSIAPLFKRLGIFDFVKKTYKKIFKKIYLEYFTIFQGYPA